MITIEHIEDVSDRLCIIELSLEGDNGVEARKREEFFILYVQLCLKGVVGECTIYSQQSKEKNKKIISIILDNPQANVFTSNFHQLLPLQEQIFSLFQLHSADPLQSLANLFASCAQYEKMDTSLHKKEGFHHETIKI